MNATWQKHLDYAAHYTKVANALFNNSGRRYYNGRIDKRQRAMDCADAAVLRAKSQYHFDQAKAKYNAS